MAEKELENVREQVKLITEQAEKAAQERIKEAQEKAQKQAEEIIEQARKKVENERMQAIEAFKDKAASLAVEIASRIITNNVTAEENKEIIDKFLEKVELK